MKALVAAACVIAAACHMSGPEPAIGTRIVGAFARSGDSIITNVTVVNELNRERSVALAPCPPRNTVRLTLVGGAPGAYHGTWDYAVMDSVRQLRRDFTRPPCTSFGLDASLPAKARVTSRFIGFRPIDVLGDSLPDGRYAVWLFPRIYGIDPGGIPAGEITLRRR